jgi:DNA-directed RNA polymerase specialized sigma subunit
MDNELTEDQKLILNLFYRRQINRESIANYMGITIKDVKKNEMKAIKIMINNNEQMRDCDLGMDISKDILLGRVS